MAEGRSKHGLVQDPPPWSVRPSLDDAFDSCASPDGNRKGRDVQTGERAGSASAHQYWTVSQYCSRVSRRTSAGSCARPPPARSATHLYRGPCSVLLANGALPFRLGLYSSNIAHILSRLEVFMLHSNLCPVGRVLHLPPQHRSAPLLLSPSPPTKQARLPSR